MRRYETSGGFSDRHWSGGSRLAVTCALLFCVMSILADREAGSLTLPRILLWCSLSAVVGVLLLPQRVSAGPGWLAVRTLGHRRTVRTDALQAVRRQDGVCARLVLSDTRGHHLDLDVQVLVANPLLWHELDRGVRRSVERGTLRSGADVIDRLGHRIDEETARAVLRASGLY